MSERKGDDMVRIELETGEEAIQRIVTKYGRIEGLKKWVGSTVMLIRTKDNKPKPEKTTRGGGIT